MSGERREHPRFPVSLAGEIETDAGRASVAITRDLSTTGVLILSRREHPIGAQLKIKMAFRDTEIALTGKVVRRDDIDPEVSTLWRYTVALMIDPSPAFDQLMAELTAAESKPRAEQS